MSVLLNRRARFGVCVSVLNSCGLTVRAVRSLDRAIPVLWSGPVLGTHIRGCWDGLTDAVFISIPARSPSRKREHCADDWNLFNLLAFACLVALLEMDG